VREHLDVVADEEPTRSRLASGSFDGLVSRRLDLAVSVVVQAHELDVAPVVESPSNWFVNHPATSRFPSESQAIVGK